MEKAKENLPIFSNPLKPHLTSILGWDAPGHPSQIRYRLIQFLFGKESHLCDSSIK
jgi:hypothetical protein